MWTERQKFWYSLKTHNGIDVGIVIHIIFVTVGALSPDHPIVNALFGLCAGFVYPWAFIVISAYRYRQQAYRDYYDTKD